MKYCVLLVCLFCYVSMAVDIGSDTAVNRFDTQQDLADGDRIAGFAALDAGFSFNSPQVTATFDSFFPVSGEIMTNFGTLDLNQDLILQDIASISVWGNINGNGHLLEFAPSVDCMPLEGGNGVCMLTFTFEEVKAANVNTVNFSFDNQFLVAGINADLEVDEVINENFLEFKATTALARTVNGAKWHPSKDYIGLGIDSGTGDELFTYTFDRVGNTLTLIDSVDIGSGGNNSVNEVAWHPDGDHLALASDSNAGEIQVFVVNADGTFGASTLVSITPDVNSVDWDTDGGFLAIGTDQQGGTDELQVYSFTKSPLALTLDASFNTAAQINSVKWNTSATANGEIVVGSQSGNTLRMFRHDGAGTLTEITTGITLATIVNSVDWHSEGTCIVAGLNNNSEGTSGETRTYSFVNDTLTEVSSIETGDDTLSVAWSPDGRLLATGDDGLAGTDPAIDLYEVVGFGTGFLIFDSIHLLFNGNATLNEPAIQFTGDSSINGQGHVLSFAPTFSLAIQSNSSVLFKDLTLKGINTGKLTLADSTSTVSFQNVKLVLDDDYVFDAGHFELLKNLTIFGDEHSFIYQSTEASTIRGGDPKVISEGVCQPGFCGELILDKGVTFSYDVTQPNLLVLEGKESKIIMHSASLAATTSLQLTTGKLRVDGKSFFISPDGIVYGDGTVANNLDFEILPAANIEVTGKLINQNV